MKLSFLKINLKQKVSILGMLLFTVAASAQQFNLSDGLDDATQAASGLVSNLKTFMWVISAIVAIYGSFQVFQKFQNGERDTNKSVATWAGAFIFFFAAGFIIESAFGVS